MNISSLCAVALGGAIGSVLRYALAAITTHFSILPIGTLLVNIIGCFAIGYFYASFGGAKALEIDKQLFSAFIFVGLLGGFTTFSAFSLDALVMFQSRGVVDSVIYVFLTVLGCLVAAPLGYWLANRGV